MYQTLYRKYRPKNLNEVVGQNVIIKTLKNAIKNNKISHAYLFTGPRGTGKTSIAKILARTINCISLENTNPCNKCVNCTQNLNQPIDIIEIDAASNNGVDEIRELKSKVNLVPSINKYKVYIIDEVHMLTIGAFNALLKTLEEPPSHVVFVLATTEPHKIPVTILSRCQRLDFKKISNKDIINRLKYISEKENIFIDENSLKEIARISNGGMRDAINMLDQLNAYSDEKITINDIHEVNGSLTSNEIKKFIYNLEKNNLENLLNLIDVYDENGKDFIKLTEEILFYLRNIILKENVPNYFKNLNLNDEEYDININLNKLIIYINRFNEMLLKLKTVSNTKLLFELNIIDMINIENKQQKIKVNRIKENKKIEKNINFEKLKELKNIRINNTLCNFNKKKYLEIKQEMEKINKLIIDPEYNEYASIVLDGTLKAYGNNHLIFVFETKNGQKLYNENLIFIDKMFEFLFSKSYKSIAVDISEWNKIKEDFNNSKKNYEYINEPDDLKEQLFLRKEDNDIEQLFGNIVEYN